MKEIKVTNIIKLYTLLLLNMKPMHGYELIKWLEDCMNKKISASHVYPFLKELQKNKLISLTSLKSSGERDKKQYKLTEKGKYFANSLINQFSVMVESAVGNKIKECAHCDCKIYNGGYEKKIGNKNLTFCCEHCAKAFIRKF